MLLGPHRNEGSSGCASSSPAPPPKRRRLPDWDSAGGRWPGLGAAGRPLSLEGCLRRFTAPETLDADNPWRCGSCAAPRRAVKRIALWRAPEILVCCLKRFGGRGKLDGDVDFPLDGLDLAPYVAHGGPGLVYDLFAAGSPASRDIVFLF